MPPWGTTRPVSPASSDPARFRQRVGSWMYLNPPPDAPWRYQRDIHTRGAGLSQPQADSAVVLRGRPKRPTRRR
jgi:hypothetical protein